MLHLADCKEFQDPTTTIGPMYQYVISEDGEVVTRICCDCNTWEQHKVPDGWAVEYQPDGSIRIYETPE